MGNYLCPKEVAALLGVAPRTAAALMRAGEIASFRVGIGEKLLRTTRAKLDEYTARQFERARVAA